jgi:3,4-dihydroxy 2-butanone 4-phosphate synthase/GTP cyclohydrolase II
VDDGVGRFAVAIDAYNEKDIARSEYSPPMTTSATREGFCTVEAAIEELRAGRMIVLVDDEFRENEGDLSLLPKVTPGRSTSWSATLRHSRPRHVRALRSAALRGARPTSIRRPRRGRHTSTPATASPPVLGRGPAHTIRVAIEDRTTPADLIIGKGHVPGCAPRRRCAGAGRPHQGSVDLARLAGLKEAAVICEVMTDDGRMARLPDLLEFTRRHGLKMCTIEDLRSSTAGTANGSSAAS